MKKELNFRNFRISGKVLRDKYISDIVKVGDYVIYKPVCEHYEIRPCDSGYGLDQICTPYKHKIWKVFKIDDSQVELISAHSVGNLTLGDLTGYTNAVEVLNKLACQYENPKFSVKSRSLGYTISSRKVNLELAREELIMAKADFWANDDLLWLVTHDELLTNLGSTWLASTFYFRDPVNKKCNMGVRDITYPISRKIDSLLLSRDGDDRKSQPFWQTRGVCPIITLKKEVKVFCGRGTAINPYRITI